MAGKLARIQYTRLHPLHRTLNRPRAGLRVDGLVERAGQRVLELSVELRRSARPEDLPLAAARYETFGMRQYPGLEGGAAFRDLVRVDTRDRKVDDVWEGEGRLRFGDSQLDRLSPLGPLEVMAGHFASYGYTLTGVSPLTPQPVRSD